jgi:hypothetical protein
MEVACSQLDWGSASPSIYTRHQMLQQVVFSFRRPFAKEALKEHANCILARKCCILTRSIPGIQAILYTLGGF